MSHPRPDGQRSPEQIVAERAMSEVSDVLLNIEHAVNRARRAHRIVAKDGVDRNAELALFEAAEQLSKLRKRLMQDTYYTGDAIRLI